MLIADNLLPSLALVTKVLKGFLQTHPIVLLTVFKQNIMHLLIA